MGANVQCTPCERASRAATDAAASTSSGFRCRRLPQGDRKDGSKAMNDIAADDQRDTQPSLVDRDALHGIDFRNIGLVENRAKLPLTNQIVQPAGRDEFVDIPVGSPPIPLTCHIWPIFSARDIWASNACARSSKSSRLFSHGLLVRA